MMKRVVCRSFGTPDGVVVEKTPIPEPGPRDVLIRITAANVSFVDRLITRGGYQVRPPLPFTPGAVGAGEVITAGAEVTHLAPGTRVAVLKSSYGTWATHVLAPAWAAVPVPPNQPTRWPRRRSRRTAPPVTPSRSGAGCAPGSAC